MPGPFDYAKGISFMKHKLPYLYGWDLRHAIADRLGWLPRQMKFLNDAAAYMLGEIGAGAAKGFSRVVVLTLGTGVGSGFAIDGKVQTEGKGVPPGGEIWNVAYEGGIVEDQISTRALQKSYHDRTGNQAEVAAIAAARGEGSCSGGSVRCVRPHPRQSRESTPDGLCAGCRRGGRRHRTLGAAVSAASPE